MASESNWAGQVGQQNHNNQYSDFRKMGMGHDHASEAAAAAERQRQAMQPKPSGSGNNG